MNSSHSVKILSCLFIQWGTQGVMVIVIGNGYSDLNSNPGWGCLYFT